MLINFSQKRTQKKYLLFKSIDGYIWKDKARQKIEKQKEIWGWKIGKVWLNPQDIKTDDLITYKKSVSHARYQLSWLYFAVNLY